MWARVRYWHAAWLCVLWTRSQKYLRIKKYLNLPKKYGPTTQGPTDLLVPGVDVSAGRLLQLQVSGGGPVVQSVLYCTVLYCTVPVVESVPPKNLGLGAQLGA